MDKTILYEQIEDYLQDRLSADDQEKLEQAIQQDEDLAEVLAIHRDIIHATGEEDILALRAQMEALFQKDDEKEEPDLDTPDTVSGGGTLSSWWLLLAIPLLLLWWFTQRQSTPSLPVEEQEQVAPPRPVEPTRPVAENEESTVTPTDPAPPSNPIAEEAITEEPLDTPTTLPATNDQEYLALATTNFASPGTILTRSTENEASQLQLAQAAYEAGEKEADAIQRRSYFEEVITRLTQAKADEEAIRYLRAHAYFQLGQYPAAASDFQALTDSFDYGYNADWGYLLSLIAQGPEQEAAYTEQLDKLVGSTSHSFHAQAVELQAKLREIED